MKHLKYILIPAMAGIFFTACNTAPVGPSQAELDTQVEAKVKAATDQLQADCTSRLMTAAQMKADSIMAKKALKPAARPVAAAPVAAPRPVATPKPTPASKPKVKPTPKPKPQTIGNGKPKMGDSKPNEVGSGKPKMGGTQDSKGKTDDTKVGNGKPKMGDGN